MPASGVGFRTLAIFMPNFSTNVRITQTMRILLLQFQCQKYERSYYGCDADDRELARFLPEQSFDAFRRDTLTGGTGLLD